MPSSSIIALLTLALPATLHAGPCFVAGQNPKPAGKSWKPVPALSDDFNGTTLDAAKWQRDPEGNGWSWIGRPPALFRPENVTVHDGKMHVTVGQLDPPVELKGSKYTHQGAIVRSLHPGQAGWFFECRMKANQTVMSSTFWLMTKNTHRKKLELDIQECVGRTTELTPDWAKTWDQIFHSNTIHRTNKFNRESVRWQAQQKTPTRNHERFYVYGAWWKSPREIVFFLDGRYAYTIRPGVDWDVPAYIQMAIETYDWNPIPPDGGLVESGTHGQRTTQYDWVRVWRLE